MSQTTYYQNLFKHLSSLLRRSDCTTIAIVALVIKQEAVRSFLFKDIFLSINKLLTSNKYWPVL